MFTKTDVERFYNSKILIRSDGSVKITDYVRPVTYIDKGFEVLQKNNIKIKGRVSSINNKKENGEMKNVRQDSLARTRNNLIDYDCENSSVFKSFVTLTFADNVTQIDVANKIFAKWRKSVKRYCDNHNIDFVYLGVPEFQKRGAVHYHLLTSLPCECDIIPRRKPINLWNSEEKKWTVLDFYDLKYWGSGWSTAFDIVKDTDSNFNVALYITKYLYKDLDDRLFGHTRLLKSNSLKKPDVFKLMRDNPEYIEVMEYIKKYDVQKSFRFAGDKDKPYIIPFDMTIYENCCDIDKLKNVLHPYLF